jgi:hypothetical protein
MVQSGSWEHQTTHQIRVLKDDTEGDDQDACKHKSKVYGLEQMNIVYHNYTGYNW